MRKNRYLPVLFALLLIATIVTACSNRKNGSDKSKNAQGICGSWAYIHDKETEAAVFREDGTAKYEDKDYTYEYDDQFITLKSTDGETRKVRYKTDDKGIYLFSTTTYVYNGDSKPDGLIGDWSCDEKKWSFSFHKDGKFMEDGFFSGTYELDEKDSSFKLIYEDQFETTTCYYQADQDKLQIEYPWQMVKTGSK